MRHTAITVAGYPSGQTDFDPIFASAGLAERQQLLGLVQRIADGIVDPDNGQFTSIVVIGHSDRQDLRHDDLRRPAQQRDRRGSGPGGLGVGVGQGDG